MSSKKQQKRKQPKRKQPKRKQQKRKQQKRRRKQNKLLFQEVGEIFFGDKVLGNQPVKLHQSAQEPSGVVLDSRDNRNHRPVLTKNQVHVFLE